MQKIFTSPSDVALMNRLRQALGDAVRTEIAHTVDDPRAVSTELQYLIEVLS